LQQLLLSSCCCGGEMVGKGGKGVEDAEVMPVNRINETTKTEIQTQAHTYRHIKYAKA